MNQSEKIINLVGLAHRAKKVAVGRSAVKAAAAKKTVHLLLIANDTPDKTVGKFIQHLETSPVYRLPFGKDRLGSLFSRNQVSFIALTDFSFARGIRVLLTVDDMFSFRQKE